MAKKIKKTKYDGVVSLMYPIHITNDKGEIISIYGWLYNQEERHGDDLFIWEVNRFISYLLGSSIAQTNGAGLSPEMWILPSGRMVNLGVEHKNLIYRVMKDRLMPYRFIEFLLPLEVGEDDVDDIFIISQEFMAKLYQDPYN